MHASATLRPLRAPRPAAPRRRSSALIAVAALTLAGAGALTLAGPAAAKPSTTPSATPSARYTTRHDPFGKVTGVKFVAAGLQVTGWAADPDARTANAGVLGILDGHTHAGAATTSLPNAAVTKKYKLGATPGFTLTIPVPAGRHTACVAVRNVGSGLRVLLKCIAMPRGRTLSSAQVAARSPKGTYTGITATSTSLRVRGTAYDPDYSTRRTAVTLYVDNSSAATVLTGYDSAFDVTVPVSRGTHVGCLWALNIGWGHNTFLGCKSIDTRGHGTGTVTQPTLNKKVLSEAKKHIVQRYVWGATGPKKFDCSGLVMYSYHKFGYSTPRVSEAQFLAARLIPQSRAVPGDLVFYSDTQGDIYHVGIYSGPNMSVAAIDTQEGVNYQRIYPSGLTFFGSFTHS